MLDVTEFAGYTLTAELGPCNGGVAFRATHPSFPTPVVLRKLRAELLGPGNDPEIYVAHARAASAVINPHLVRLLDAGIHDGEPFVVVELFEGADLETLVRDIGPMPTSLACAYIQQAASGLSAAHIVGLTHGNLCPGVLVVGPLVPRQTPNGSPAVRPAPDAVAKVSELGLVPHRSAAAGWAESAPSADTFRFLPPERVTNAESTPAGDVYGLGATLFFLLTNRGPLDADTATEMISRITTTSPIPLKQLRPDVPDDLAWLIGEMLAKDPLTRPTMSAVDARLARFVPRMTDSFSDIIRESKQLPPLADAALISLSSAEMRRDWVAVPYTSSGNSSGRVHFDLGAAAVPVPGESEASEYMLDSTDDEKSPFAPPSTDRPIRHRPASVNRQRLRMWFLIGAAFWVTAGLLWLVLLNQAGCFGGDPELDPSAPKQYRR